MADIQWTGPFRIQEYSCQVMRNRELRPPDAPGLYVLTERSWSRTPTGEANILYVGQARYLRYRIGQFLSELIGFTSDDPADKEAYQHRGGHQLWHRFCVRREIEPADLYLAWRAEADCLDCAQAQLAELVPMQWRSSLSRACGHHTMPTNLTNGRAAPGAADFHMKKRSVS